MEETAPRRRSKAERHEELLEAAVALAAEQGLDRLTVRDVAQRVGVTSGLFHHYFPSIDDLVIATFRRIASADLEWLHGGLAELPPTEALSTFLTRSVAPERDPSLTVWLSGWLAASRRPGLRDAATELMGIGAAALAAIMRRGTDTGDFHCADPEASAQRIYVVADGFLIQRALNIGSVERLGIESFLRKIVEDEIGAPLAQPAGRATE
ncbi:TetR/AcrR family transcriptional regulator [Leucobacter chromiireducens]|uniref:TetR family transcriptional regulator n=1 Tax=Leucobacter chromiireducens subsp. chromiireducens TaxID=660067 RepID=A0ABS1SLQ9_9MICO|nr:TetR/AcrR family transcriptional regulator [Leucobacter chromiireducens]MBL3688914.1 TetR family transcriptional regulator [Leucobacter chromiireducens subsp. chromiireducens]